MEECLNEQLLTACRELKHVEEGGCYDPEQKEYQIKYVIQDIVDIITEIDMTEEDSD